MNIFPLDIQYLISEFILNKNKKINKKEIILLYTYPGYSHKELKEYYYQEKILQEKIEFEYYLFRNTVRCGNIRLMKFFFKSECPWKPDTFLDEIFNISFQNLFLK